MQFRAALVCLLFLAFGTLCHTPSVRAATVSDDDPIVQIHRIARSTDKAATQARALGWVAVSLGFVNTVILVIVAAKLFNRELPPLFSADPRLSAIRRRQQNIARNVAALNDRLDAYFRASETERKGLVDAVQAINERMRAASAEADRILGVDEIPKPSDG